MDIKESDSRQNNSDRRMHSSYSNKTMLSRRALLLDMDGVVLHRSHPALQTVSNKAVRYVSRSLNVSLLHAERINKMLYTEFSHTLLGLRHVYEVDRRVVDFANDVYDRHSMQQLVQGCRDHTPTKIRAAEVAGLLHRCQHAGVPAYIFSNAPSEWCLSALDELSLLGDRSGMIPEERVLGSDHVVFGKRRDNRVCLKPAPLLYESVEKLLKHTARSLDVSIDFVDDSFKNLVPIIGRPGWTALHFVEMPHASADVLDVRTPRLRTVFNMAEVATFVSREAESEPAQTVGFV